MTGEIALKDALHIASQKETNPEPESITHNVNMGIHHGVRAYLAAYNSSQAARVWNLALRDMITEDNPYMEILIPQVDLELDFENLSRREMQACYESELEKALEEVDEFKWVEKSETKSKPRLGVYIESAENGVAITSISEHSIAESADLKSGDVITSFNGVSVSSPDALIEAVQQSPTGEAVVVEFQRDGEKMTKTVTFEKK